MDSCHLFNFLFGSKKMTTELSRCFSSMGSSTNRKQQRANDSRRRGPLEPAGSSAAGSHPSSSSSPPPSPLRQFQQRIVATLANNPAPKPKKPTGAGSREEQEKPQVGSKKILKTSCDSKCGTYRATLVEALPEDEDRYNDDEDFEAKNKPIDIVENPSFGRQAANNEVSQAIIPSTNLDLQMMDSPGLPAGHQWYNNDNRSSQDDESNMVGGQPIINTNINNNDNNNNNTSQMMSNVRFKRVVLYSDCEPGQENRQIVPSSAEVFNMVPADLGDSRAKLRRVGSLTNQQGNNMNDKTYYDDDNNYEDEDNRRSGSRKKMTQADDDNDGAPARDKRSVYVRSLVQSIESNSSFESATKQQRSSSINDHNNNGHSDQTTINYNSAVAGFTKPVTFVKPMPPKTPPKTAKAKCLNMQLSLNKPTKIQQLFQEESFLGRFFGHLDPIDRCVAAQVCRLWRNILYSNQNYWQDLVMVVDCTQMRREHLVDCILSTLQTAKLKSQSHLNNRTIPGSDSSHRLVRGVRSSSGLRSLSEQQQQQPPQQASLEWSQQNYYHHHPQTTNSSSRSSQFDMSSGGNSQFIDSSAFMQQEKHYDYRRQQYTNSQSLTYDAIDLEDVWRIQELCNRFTAQRNSNSLSRQQSHQPEAIVSGNHQATEQQQQQQQQICTASKSSSIPSQISSTLSSVSLSSLLSPLSESSRIESLKEKLYVSFDNRGFDALCLFGATNDDIEDLISKTPLETHKRIVVGRLNNCSITNTGLELFIGTFNQLEELELSGCNEITNSFEFKSLIKLKRLIITDCINIADGLAQKLIQIIGQLDELTIQAYHLTDAFLDYLGLNSDTSNLRRLELPNCKEITNQSLVTIAKHFSQLEALSISGSTKISDDGIEILAEKARQLKVLDLSWCSRITDASLECIACDLGDTLTDLILDRNIHVTDMGLGYLTTMSKLKLLHIRWCPRITDVGLESVIAINSLRHLSLAGIHQITARSLLCLIEANLVEVELTNCPAVNHELALFLSAKMPKCNIIF